MIDIASLPYVMALSGKPRVSCIAMSVGRRRIANLLKRNSLVQIEIAIQHTCGIDIQG